MVPASRVDMLARTGFANQARAGSEDEEMRDYGYEDDFEDVKDVEDVEDVDEEATGDAVSPVQRYEFEDQKSQFMEADEVAEVRVRTM
jgi:hypothetical protein